MEDKRQQTDEALGGLFGNSSLFSGLPSGVDTAAIQKPPTSDIGDSGPMSGESSSDNYNINVNVTQNLVQKEVEKKVNGILNTTSDANQIKKNYTGQSSVNDIQSTFIESPNFNRTLYTSNNSSSSNNQSINENLAISSDTINDKPYQNAFGGNKNSLFTSSVNNYTTGTSTSSNTANNTASHHYVNPNSPEGRVAGVKNQTSNFNYVNPNSPEGRIAGVDTNTSNFNYVNPNSPEGRVTGVENQTSNFNYVNPNSPEGRVTGVENQTSNFNYVNPNSPEGRIAGVENQTSDRSVKNTDKTAANPATTPVVVATAPPAVAAPVILPKPSKKPSNPTNNKSKVIRNSTDASSPTHNTKTNNSRIERGKANNAAKTAANAAKKIARDSQNPDSKTFVGPQQEPVVGPPAPKPEPNPNAGKRRTDTPADVDASNKALSINEDGSFNIPEKTTRTSTSPKLTNDVGNRPYINPNSPEGRIAGVDKPEFSIGTSSTGNPIVTGGSYKNPNSPEGRLLEDDTINIDGTMKDTDKFGPKTLDAAKRLAKEDTAKVEGKLRADINQNGSMPTDIAGVETAKPNISTTTNNDNGETTNETNNQSTTNAPSSSQTTNITNEVHNHHYVNPNSPEGRIANMDKPQFSIGTSSTGTPIVTGGSYKNPNSPEGRIAGVEVNKNSSITTNTSNNTASHNNTSNNTASHSNTNNSRIERGKANNAAKAADKAAKKIARDSQNPDSKTFVGPQQEPVVGPPAPKPEPNPNAGKRRTDTPADIDASGKPLSINEDGSFNISSEAKSQADDNRKSMSDARTQDTERSRRLNVSPNQRVEGFDSSGKTSKANPNFNYKNPNSPEGRLLADDTINPNGSMKDTDKFGPKTLDAAKRLAKEDTARVEGELRAADINQNGPMPIDVAGIETAKPNISTTTNNDNGETTNETNNQSTTNTPSSSHTTNITNEVTNHHYVNPNSPQGRIAGIDKPQFSIGTSSTGTPIVTGGSYKNPNSPEGRLLADDTINPNGSMKDTDKFGPKTLDAAKRLAKEDTARVTKEVTPIVENQLKKEAADITQNGSMPTDIAGVETAKPNISTTTNNDTLIETNNEFPITTPSSSNTTNTNTYNQNYVTNDESLSMYSNTAQYSDPSETYNQLSNIDYTNTDDEYTNNNTQVDSTAFIDSYTQGDATDFNVNLDSNSSDTTIEGVSNDANVNSISRPYNDTILDDGNSNSEPNTPSSSSSPVSSVSSSQQNNNTTINNGNQNISNTSSNITNGNVTINQSTTQQNTTNNIGGTTNSTSTSGTMVNGFNQNNSSVDSNSNSNQNYGNIRHNTTINAMLGGQSTTHALLSSYNDTIGIDNSESNQINISNNSTDAFNDNSQSNQSSFNNNQSASSNTSNPSYTNNNFNSNQTSYTGDTNNTTNRFSNSVEFDGINNLFKSDYSTKISNISRSSTLNDTNENIKQIIREIISEESEKTKENEESLYEDMDIPTPSEGDDVQFMDNQSAATDNINTNLVDDYSSLMDIMEKISSPPIWRTAIG